MTVSDRDLSNYDGKPIVLYQFFRKSTPTILPATEVTTYWRYTSADSDYTLDGDGTYVSVAIADDGIRQSGDSTADQLTITMPADLFVPQLFVGSPPSDPIRCVIRHTHEGETDAFIVWSGIVGQVTRVDAVSASVLCNTVGATMDRGGLRLAWSRNCPHALYDTECRADPNLFHIVTTVSALNGEAVAASLGGLTVGVLNGGFLEWVTDDGHTERRGIIEHGVNFVRVLGTTDRMSVGLTVLMFFGCGKTRQVCHDTFNNLANHGGHAYMPDINPFSGDNIF